MAVLASYVSGRWQRPSDEGVALRDATTGVEVARISSTGIDMAAAVDYGRRVGGPALRALTFHQRAGLLKAVASYLKEHRDDLYGLSTQTGATRADARVDVDGGIGTLLGYARIGRLELSNDVVYVEGPVEALSRDGRFVGQHIATSHVTNQHGVSVATYDVLTLVSTSVAS